jgi:hypothetical protein
MNQKKIANFNLNQSLKDFQIIKRKVGGKQKREPMGLKLGKS